MGTQRTKVNVHISSAPHKTDTPSVTGGGDGFGDGASIEVSEVIRMEP